MTPSEQLELCKEAKKADMPQSARIVAAILSMGLAEAARRSESDNKLEDRAAEEHARYMESKSMEATLEALKTSSVNYAQDVGRLLAHGELEKGAAVPGLGAVGRLVGKAFTRRPAMENWGRHMLPDRMARSAPQGAFPTTQALHVPQLPKRSVRGPVLKPKPAAPLPSRPQGGFPESMEAAPSLRAAPKTDPKGPLAASQTGAKTRGAAKPAADSGPLVSGKTKALGLAGAGILAGGYMGGQALGAARDIMMRPRGGAHRYGSRPGMRQLSPYGYPMY